MLMPKYGVWIQVLYSYINTDTRWGALATWLVVVQWLSVDHLWPGRSYSIWPFWMEHKIKKTIILIISYTLQKGVKRIKVNLISPTIASCLNFATQQNANAVCASAAAILARRRYSSPLGVSYVKLRQTAAHKRRPLSAVYGKTGDTGPAQVCLVWFGFCCVVHCVDLHWFALLTPWFPSCVLGSLC